MGALLLCFFTISACDSGNDGPDFTTEDVLGTYTFSQLSFETEGTGIADADVLGTLVAANTNMVLASNRMFLLNYQQQGGSQLFLAGTFSVSGDQISFNFDSAADAGRKSLLFPDQFTLDILNDGRRLQRDIDRNNVDLSAFSEEIFGSGFSADGTLRVDMRR